MVCLGKLEEVKFIFRFVVFHGEETGKEMGGLLCSEKNTNGKAACSGKCNLGWHGWRKMEISSRAFFCIGFMTGDETLVSCEGGGFWRYRWGYGYGVEDGDG